MGVHSVADVLKVSFIQPSTVCVNLSATTGKSGGSQSEPDQNKHLQVQDEESDSQKPGTRRKPLRHEKKERESEKLARESNQSKEQNWFSGKLNKNDGKPGAHTRQSCGFLWENHIGLKHCY